MEQNIVKRLVTKDGSQRINIIQEYCPDNPRYSTDEPLHCEDWCNCTIMLKNEREGKSSSARKLLEYLLSRYVDCKKMINELIQAGKQEKRPMDDKLVYNRKSKEWELWSYGIHYDCETRKNVEGWNLNDSVLCNREEIAVYSLLDLLCDDTVDYLAAHCMTDGVKMMSYSFGYYGSISFSDGASCSSEGIAWLEKEEFLKYSGCDEKCWKEHTCTEIDWLHEELEAWGDGDVYGFTVEKRDEVKVHEEHGDGSVSDYVRTDWEETDSCWGFYGEVDKVLPAILDAAGFKMDELEDF